MKKLSADLRHVTSKFFLISTFTGVFQWQAMWLLYWRENNPLRLFEETPIPLQYLVPYSRYEWLTVNSKFCPAQSYFYIFCAFVTWFARACRDQFYPMCYLDRWPPEAFNLIGLFYIFVDLSLTFDTCLAMFAYRLTIFSLFSATNHS